MKKSYIFKIFFVLLPALFVVSKSAVAEEYKDSSSVESYEVVANKLDDSRNNLSTRTGTSAYSFDKKDIDNLPAGSGTSMNKLLLQAPGVVQNSYGQIHVRDDHGNLQYRINGIIIPEGISGFGQVLDPHFAENITLLTGALPAEYGFHTAGVVDIKTKDGAFEKGGRSEFTVGSRSTIGGSQEFSGSSGKFNYYLNASYLENSLGIESPTGGVNAIHDFTRQDKQFGYLSYFLSPSSRLSLIVGNATNRFEVPNNPGQTQNYTLNGVSSADSGNLDERQFEHNRYAIAALQGTTENDLDYQLSLFTRYSNVYFKPDYNGDLIFNGSASNVENQSVTNGLQSDFSYKLNEANLLRFGLFASFDTINSNKTTGVFPATGGTQTGSDPFNIVDNDTKHSELYGTYLQNEWKALDKLTINYGLRFDAVRSYVNDSQLSPRLGAVYDLSSKTKIHAGYSKYFTPPPTELISTSSIESFRNTTNEPDNFNNSKVQAEKTNYYDVGVTHKFNENYNAGLDAYYKDVHNLLDEGQFGTALIYTPFNYREAKVYGLEFSNNYTRDKFSSYLNISLEQAKARDITSGQYLFDTTELNYIASHDVYLDHNQTLSASFGANYSWYNTNYSVDGIYGSGLRKGDYNSKHMPSYTQINLGANRDFTLPIIEKFNLRFSVVNALDKSYQLHDGSGIGVAAPQYGPRRGYYMTVVKNF